MIYGHVAFGLAAVHAAMPVSHDYILAGQENTAMWNANVRGQSNDRRERVGSIHRSNLQPVASLHNLGFAQKNKHKCPARGTHRERLIVLIEQ